MRLKAIAIFLMVGFAVFTSFYWITDSARRAEIYAAEQEELLAFGEIVFSYDPTNTELRAAGCARCHGPEGLGGPIPNDPNGRNAPNLHSTSLAEKWLATGGNADPAKTDLDNYVFWVIQYGGVMVSGDIHSPMPAWRDTLSLQQMEALTSLIGEWLRETIQAPEGTPIPNTVEAGAEVYVTAGCAGCHGSDLAGVPGTFPSLQTIGTELVTDLPVPPVHLDQMQIDYDADKATFLENWILNGAVIYNEGNPIGGMPAYDGQLSDDELQALITFLLDQT